MKPRSVSQHNTYHRCPYQYYLERIEKAPKRPASWLSQGLAVHKAMELWETSNRTLTLEELDAEYDKEFKTSISELCEDEPNLDKWFGSGPYGPVEDIERRYELGRNQVKALVNYCLSRPEEVIWTTPDGKRAIELPFEATLGEVTVIGFIDQILETPKGLLVRDIKTGAKPGDSFQLATYAEAIHQIYGIDIGRGDYLMGKTGRPSRVTLITKDMKQNVHTRFAELEENIQEGIFPPEPDDNKCFMCSVAEACQYKITR